MRYSDLPGWFDYADVYDAAVADAKDGAIFVEIGCWLGRSTAYLADAIKRSGKRITFYAVDSFVGVTAPGDATAAAHAGEDIAESFLANMRACGVDDVVRLIQSPSVEAAKVICDGSVDFCFIDGSHDYESVKADIAAWLPKMKAGAVMAGHDRNQTGVWRAVCEAFGVPKDVGPLAWWVRV